MLVKTIIDNENGKKWEINKVDEDRYTVDYYEFFQAVGWKKKKWDLSSIGAKNPLNLNSSAK